MSLFYFAKDIIPYLTDAYRKSLSRKITYQPNRKQIGTMHHYNILTTY